MLNRYPHVRLLLEVAAVLVLAELLVMVVLDEILPKTSDALAATLDAALLVAISCPLVLWRLHADARSKRADTVGESRQDRLTLARAALAIIGIGAAIEVAYQLDSAESREAQT